jgi:hypothetical protein
MIQALGVLMFGREFIRACSEPISKSILPGMRVQPGEPNPAAARPSSFAALNPQYLHRLRGQS